MVTWQIVFPNSLIPINRDQKLQWISGGFGDIGSGRSAKVFAMKIFIDRLALERSCLASTLILMLSTALHPLHAQAPAVPATSAPAVPEWAEPGSPTHVQVPPPADFHRPSRNFDAPIGIFQGQSD